MHYGRRDRLVTQEQLLAALFGVHAEAGDDVSRHQCIDIHTVCATTMPSCSTSALETIFWSLDAQEMAQAGP